LIKVFREAQPATFAKLLLHISDRFATNLIGGCAMSYQNQKIRLRKLPII